MASFKDQTVFLIMQFLKEEGKYQETIRKLGQESGCWFDMRWFEEIVLDGRWAEVEKYLSGFTKVEDNCYSTAIILEIRKHRYLEALVRPDYAAAREILTRDLKVFEPCCGPLFGEMTQLLTVESFKKRKLLSAYRNARDARQRLLADLRNLFEKNPVFRGKLRFPNIMASRLRAIIDQSMHWQHKHCKNPSLKPIVRTLFEDHSCEQPSSSHATFLPDQVSWLMAPPGLYGIHPSAQPGCWVAPSDLYRMYPSYVPIDLRLLQGLGTNSHLPDSEAAIRTVESGGVVYCLSPAILEPIGVPEGTGQMVVDRGAQALAFSMKGKDVKSGEVDESTAKGAIWKPLEINEPSVILSLRLPDPSPVAKVSTEISPESAGPSCITTGQADGNSPAYKSSTNKTDG